MFSATPDGRIRRSRQRLFDRRFDRLVDQPLTRARTAVIDDQSPKRVRYMHISIGECGAGAAERTTVPGRSPHLWSGR